MAGIPKSPEKAQQSVPSLPEKFQNLGVFFNCLVSAIVELKSQGMETTFSKICPRVDVQNRPRRINHQHLAQMEHILRDEIEMKTVWSTVPINRISVTKKITKKVRTRVSLNPHLRIALEVPHLHVALKCLETEISAEKLSYVRKLFWERLAELASSHPQGIPKGTLPDPFHRRIKPCRQEIQVIPGVVESLLHMFDDIEE